MSMKGKTLVKGHSRARGSIPLVSVNGGPYVGRAMCECGATSSILRSAKERSTWHREHKAKIVAAVDAARAK